jgi:iron(III) transport system ATP-binding protein
VRVTVQNLVKRFGDTTALRAVSLAVESRELFFLLGPSGCGKTTLLRTLAGFYQPDDGEIRFGDRPMNGVPPHERNTGMVFQNYALWPHLTVADNVGYGLEVRKVAAAERKARIAEALATVRMTDYAARSPNQLSGGQQQRVALARALVIKPDLLLLDEPLSNLDARLRLEMREEIRRIHAETRITTIYVTHDKKEALSLADRLAVLRDGVIEQIGGPREVYRQPANRFVADFIGETNWLAGEVASRDGDRLNINTSAGSFLADAQGRLDGEDPKPKVRASDLRNSEASSPGLRPPSPPFGMEERAGERRRSGSAPGAKLWLGFRPEAVALGRGEMNNFSARITHVSYLGEIEQYELAFEDGTRFKVFEQNPRLIREVGARLELHVRPADLLILPRD